MRPGREDARGEGTEADAVGASGSRSRRPRDSYRDFVRSEAYRRQRPAKARVIAALCREELTAARRVVDLGSGTGLVKKALEDEYGKKIYGVDIDRDFMETEERMVVADVLRLPLPPGSVDFAILNHLYEHVEDQEGLFRELFRVVEPGGAAYVAAGSRFAVMEPHYRLPFLSWLPRRLAHRYVRWTGRGRGYHGIRFRGYHPLVRTMRAPGFRVEDRTLGALDRLMAPVWGGRWGRMWRALRRLPEGWIRAGLRWLSPQWFFVLHKPPSP